MVNQNGMAASDQMGDGPPSKRTKFGEEGKMMLILIISYSLMILHAETKYKNWYLIFKSIQTPVLQQIYIQWFFRKYIILYCFNP